jgi:hypothetical protein
VDRTALRTDHDLTMLDTTADAVERMRAAGIEVR